MRGRVAVPVVASALFSCALLAGVLVACGLSVEGSLPAPDEGGVGMLPTTDDAAAPAACTIPADCPDPPNDCVVPACNAGACATTNVAAGTVCTSAGGKACDGNGKCVSCLAATDCPAWLTACTVSTCTSSACGSASAPKATACTDNGGRLCNGAGACVECVAATDCPAQATVCKTNTCTSSTCGTSNAVKGTSCSDHGGVVCDGSGACVPMHCTDATQDADETDVDCGGSCGATCKDTSPQQKCVVGGDCISGVCTGATPLCQPPTCSDGVQNGNETDVDCGGAGFNGKPACAACPDRKHCTKNTDCVHNTCFGAGPGTCVSCVDGLKDGNETAVDCGGATCDAQGKKCATNQACTVAADCASGYCPAGTCELRPDGSACTANAECLHGACLAVSGGGKICCNTGCTDQGATSCGTNGQCVAGGAACADYASGTKCGAATCSGNTLTPKVCNGTGTCTAGVSSTCGGHLDCNGGGTACLAGCGANSPTGDASCASGYWCDGVGMGSCQAPQASGASCDRNAQCQSACNNGLRKCK